MSEWVIPAVACRERDRVLVMAHRGWRGRFPENTMLSFQRAAELGVDALEMDIHSTADGELVVIHDATVDRTTNGKGPVQSFTLAELKQLDAGYWWTPDNGRSYPFRGQGVTIPTLAEVFAAFPNFWINIDIKQANPPIVTPFVEMIRAYGMTNQVVVGSFHEPVIQAFRQACPEVVTAASAGEVRRLLVLSRLGLGRFYRGGAQAVQIPEKYGRFQIITPRFVQAAHHHDMAVHVWTVNETAEMQRLIQLGVDGIMTDYPDRLLRLLERPFPGS